MTIPFTYLIGWSKLNTFYYGVRFAAGCSPSDLWIRYFTSSKHVKAFRKEHGEPDIIVIRKTFTNHTDARLYEGKVLRRMHVRSRADFLNQAEFPCRPPRTGQKHSDETRAKMRASAPRLPRPPEVRLKISKSNSGKPKSPEAVEKMKQALTGLKHTEQSRQNMAASKIGRKASVEHKENISRALTGSANARSKKCSYGGIMFDSLGLAAKHAGISKHLVKKDPTFHWI